MESLIPIVAITSSIGIPAVVIIIAMLVSHRRKIARYHVIEKAIDSNSSPEVIEQLVATIGEENNSKITPPRQKSLIEGTVFMAGGLGCFAIFFFTGTSGIFIPAIISTMIGLAKFVIAFFILKKDPEQS